ncbi:MAG: methionine--tRNA ligase [Spirochaetales bacterium]|nr:methionine--tRNA ligase [Spirochaetales bacterium]
MKKRLITSALPYVNNIPHLGNLIQVLSADVFARYCRLKGHETLYVCGTDEYGTATETRAIEEGITPRELCDRYYTIHKEIYEWFTIAFDSFGRTSTENHTKITQEIFLGLDKNGYIHEQTIEQLFCESCSRFLADRYVRGICPSCGSENARGDQCEDCGKLLDPTELKNPQCSVCGHTPVAKETTHLYIDLPKILPVLKKWMQKASDEGSWAKNAVQITNAWIRDGLRERCITRDLKWGIPVPKNGFENKVFYVWFDAPIGYISITANLTGDWEQWWKNPGDTELYQFIGKDNIPFHTVIFPCSLLGSGTNWTLLNHMSSSEYLNYESGKFSKSRGIGVFGNDAKESNIPADVWRFYIYYNRPEKNDTSFVWSDFKEKVNGELLGNFSNLVNRSLTFISKFYDGKVPKSSGNKTFWDEVVEREKEIDDLLNRIELRTAFHKIFELCSVGNKKFQDSEPWRTRTEAPEQAAELLFDLVYLVRDLAILFSPYLPATSAKVLGFFGIDKAEWPQLGTQSGITTVNSPELLFSKLEDDQIDALRTRFSGSQKERKQNIVEQFKTKVDLRVATITAIEQHSKADKLYVEQIDVGGETRQIVSGLVPYYKPEELLGKNVVVVANLKPAKLRGEMSQGMLLAAEENGIIEVIFAPDAVSGDRVSVEEEEPCEEAPGEIDIDTFFDIPVVVKDSMVMVENKHLAVKGKPLKVSKVKNGKVG